VGWSSDVSGHATHASRTGQHIAAPDGARIWVERCGSGTPLLLVPGLGAGNWLWDGIAPALAPRFELIMPELRGGGRSDHPDTRYSVAMFAEDVLAVLDALRIESCHLLGASLGGFVAQHLAAHWPTRVRRLVLAATSLGGDVAAGPRGEILARLIRPHGRTRRERLEDAYELGFTPEFRAARPDLLDRITAWRLEHRQPEPAYYRQLLAGHAFDGALLTPAIGANTLVCAAEHDPVVPLADVQMLAAALRDARFALFPGRHLFFMEHDAAFCEAVAAFLDEERA
jgi:pimeloyl-ACP methyl ester carboxylesterase